jgi:iron complex transport system ATP-binding protein
LSFPLIEFRDVTLMRNERVVLDRLTLSIGVGEHVAILGPNGSGKSSFIKAITRECYPLLGRNGSLLRIFGQETWNVFDLRVLLGIVSNDLLQSCTRDVTGREVVLSGFFSSVVLCPYHHVTPAMEAKARQVLDLLEIPHLAEREVVEMSSGEARRVVIARALVHDPKALVFDEPTNSLDFHAMRELRTILRKLAQSGTSIILVTHHLPDIIPEIERVVLMKAGRVFRDGSKEEMLTTGRLSELFGATVEVVRRDGYYHLM